MKKSLKVLSAVALLFTISLTSCNKNKKTDSSSVENSLSTNESVSSSTGVITSPIPVGYEYSLGDTMYDFAVTDAETGKAVQLSELLKEKKMVLLNFWYTTCSPCNEEVPYMQEAYENYSSKVEIVGLNPYAADNDASVKSFKQNYGVTFTMAKDVQELSTNFGINAFPTSIVIDRFGTICFITQGSFSDAEELEELFNIYTADNYTESKIYEGNVIRNKPTTTMPDSKSIESLINGSGFNGTYHAETNESDAEWTWPWVIDNDKKAIKPSNYHEVSSYSTIYCDFECNVDDVLAFDFFCSTETNDIVYIVVDGVVYQRISGISQDWQTCFAFVAESSGKHSLGITYLKDSSTNTGDDTIYIKNLRLTSTDQINTPTYIYRSMALGEATEGKGYSSYKTPVYNEKDGYYHVGSENGPLMLANMMSSSNWSNTYFYNYVADDKFYDKIDDPSDVLTTYASYAANSEISGYTPVTKELETAIKRAMQIYATDEGRTTYDNEWLEICYYYASYGTNGVELSDPTKGLSTFAAYEGKIGENVCPFNTQIMPRGKYTAFTPETSGVYKIIGTSQYETNTWIYDSEMNKIISDDDLLYRDSLMRDASDDNFMVYAYFQEGETYYISTAFYDFYQLGDLTFDISYVSATKDALRQCSGGAFTTSGVDENNLPDGTIIAGGITPTLNETDDLYYVDEGDGNLGSKIYADFYFATSVFPSNSIEQIISLGGFDFTKDEDGYAVDDETAEDMTELAKEYLAKVCTDESSELYGMVEVDEQLAELLQKLIDKYTFAGVDHSWTKVCYYYDHLG